LQQWKTAKSLAVFALPINLLIAFAHYLDASATYRAINYFGYREKHVLPTYLIDLTGTALVMFPLKAVVIVLAIYILDILLAEDFRKQPDMFFLIKFAIIVLGLAPAVRDVARLAMGV